MFRFFKPRPPEIPASNARDFLISLSAVAPPAGRGDYIFKKPEGGAYGFVQFIAHSHRELIIHRLWTLEPGQGNGAHMLRILCNLADQHQVELTLKTIPFGRKPHPLPREQLVAWYQRHGFEGTHKKMTRKPHVISRDSTS
jgi:hypothetical protein